MANCNKLFLDFNKDLRPSKTKRGRMRTSREDLRDKIRDYFKENHSDYSPHFFIQGSANKLVNTQILYKDNTCDLDDGVYFFRNPDVEAKTLQGWVKEAVEDATDTVPQHRRKCVRVIYQDDYHIDLPIYCKPDKDDDSVPPELADKEDEFSQSDPKEFVEWFHNEKDKDKQLVRIVKYLKAWGDKIRNKMPTGLALSVLVAECIICNERDDVALKDTLVAIKSRLDSSWKLEMPTIPHDDLFSGYDDNKKDYIFEKLDAFIEDAKKALNEPNQLKASKLWRKHLGKRFPEGKDEDTDAKEEALKKKAAILSSNPFVGRDGKVTDDSKAGKPIPDTKNYGGKI